MTLTIDLSEYTHFAQDKYGFVCFTMEKCECCGKDIYNEGTASGSLSGHNVDLLLKRNGLKQLSELPPNLWVDFHDDDDQDEEWGCDDCKL